MMMTLRWNGVARALYFAIVVDCNWVAKRGDVMALLDKIDRRVDDFLNESSFTKIVREWRAAGSKAKGGRKKGSSPSTSFEEFLALITPRRYGQSDLDLRLALLVNEQNRAFIQKSVSPDWLAAVEKIFFYLDQNAIGLLTAADISSLVACLAICKGTVCLSPTAVAISTFGIMKEMMANFGPSAGFCSLQRLKKFFLGRNAGLQTLERTADALVAVSDVWWVLRKERADPESSLRLSQRMQRRQSRGCDAAFIPNLWMHSIFSEPPKQVCNGLELFLALDAPRIMWLDETASLKAGAVHSILGEDSQARVAAKLWRSFKGKNASSSSPSKNLDDLVRDTEARRLLSSVTAYARLRQYAIALMNEALMDGTVARTMRSNNGGLIAGAFQLDQDVPDAAMDEGHDTCTAKSTSKCERAEPIPKPNIARNGFWKEGLQSK
eukprot:g4195.t1